MRCPNCNAVRLRTFETFQTDDETIRTKLCDPKAAGCGWKFTTRETISEDETIPVEIRNAKRKTK